MNYTQLGLLEERIMLVSQAVFSEKMPLKTWKMRRATYGDPVEYRDFSEWKEIAVGDHWYCRFDEAVWFETAVTVPRSMAGKRIVLELCFDGEGVVYVDGEMKSGVTHYYAQAALCKDRTRVDLADKAEAGRTYRITAQVNINYRDYFKRYRYRKYTDEMGDEYTFYSAFLGAVDPETEGYAFDLKMAYDLVKFLKTPNQDVMKRVLMNRLHPESANDYIRASRDNSLITHLIHAMGDSLNLIPLFEGAGLIREKAPEARKLLKKEIAAIEREKEGLVCLSAYAHMDLIWLWQEKHTVRKVANTMMNAWELSRRYPDYIFTYTQPYAFSMIEKHYPEVFGKVLKMVEEGFVDPVSNLWVEMDTNLAGGEAIVRQLLYGRAYYLEKFGKVSDVFMMPDSFGYAGSLPQIMRRSGIRYFLTNKLSMNEAWRFPYTLFKWRGIDGTEIASYLQQGVYNGEITPERMETTYRRMEDNHISDTVYGTFGYGDGGGGADYQMLEQYERMKWLPGVPKVKMMRYHDFFAEVTKKIDLFPVWDDELYLDRHRGTYTTHEDIKKNNRRAEYLLRSLEMAASLREILLGKEYPLKQIEALWKEILHLQFHDSLPGSAITQAMDDAKRDYRIFFQHAEALYGEVLSDLTKEIPHEDAVCFNFLSWDRETENAALPVLPSIGYTSGARKGKCSLKAENGLLENRFFRLKLAKDGCIDSIFDKRSGRETLAKKSNVLQVFEDISKPRLSAWDMHPEMEDTMEEILSLESVKVLKTAEDRAAIRVTRRYHKSRIEQDITIYETLPRIDLITHIDWQEDMKTVKAAFYPAVHARRASYEIQFGTIERPTHKNTEFDAVRFEACAHKWIDLSEQDHGFSILNDCKYGSDIHDDVMRLTLLRSPLEPDFTADRGAHDFVYSIFPHEGSGLAPTVRAGYELNVPVSESRVKAKKRALLPKEMRFISVDAENVVLDTIKKAEDGEGYILRFYECAGGSGKATVRFMKEVESVVECDLMEQNERKIRAGKDKFSFELRPYVIRSFRVKFQ